MRLRLEVRLRDPAGQVIWTGKFDGDLDDPVAWQDASGEAVAAEVLGRIFAAERARL